VGVLGCDDFGVCGGRTGESDDSDSEEVGRLGGSVSSFGGRIFMFAKDPMGLRLVIDGPRDKGRAGRLLSGSQDWMGGLWGGRSITSGVLGPGKLWVDELEGVLT
jgi:hypothetical protein